MDKSSKYIKGRNNNIKDYIGIALAALYLFTSYTANGMFLPIIIKQLSLYAFILYGSICLFQCVISGKIQVSKYTLWYGVFLLSCFFTTIYSNNPYALESDEFRSVIICFIITLLLSFFIQGETEFSIVCWSFVVSSFLLCTFLFFTGRMIGSDAERLGEEVLGNANIFATFMMYSAMFACWIMVFYKGWRRYIASTCLLIDVYALALSAGRKFFIIPFVFLYCLFLCKGSQKSKGKMVLYSLIMIIIVIITYIMIMHIPVFYNAVGIRLKQLFAQITGEKGADTSSLIRAELRKTAIQEWKERPIFGYGFDSFKYFKTWVLPTGKVRYYSHCNYTELLYNGGIIQFLLYYSLFVYGIRTVFHNKSGINKYTSFALASFISIPIFDYGCVSYDVITMQVYLLMAVLSLEQIGSKLPANNQSECSNQKKKYILH